MSSRLILVVLGKQGAGKGTQCKRLATDFAIPHVSTGDILRAAVKEQNALGQQVKAVLDAGALVSDDLVIALVADRFTQADAAGGAVLDGFPRTLAQAQALDTLLGDGGVSLCINLDVSTVRVVERLSARRVCQECGAIYQVNDISAISESCENCSGDVIQRADDQPEAITHRLDAYERDTAPLVEYYRDKNLLATVDGDQSVDAVNADLLAVISARGLA